MASVMSVNYVFEITDRYNTLSLSFSFFNTSLIQCGKFEFSYPGKPTAAAIAALPIPTSVCSIFVVSKQWCVGLWLPLFRDV